MKGIVRLVLVAACAAVAAAGGSAPAAEAGLLSCIDSPEQPFAAWGDYSPYTLAPNGSFEYGSLGWSLNGARVVASNNTLRPGSYRCRCRAALRRPRLLPA